jgi:DNA-binding PadR family transcriptional regulator
MHHRHCHGERDRRHARHERGDEGREGRGGHPWRGGGRRGGRVLDHGDLRLVILQLIQAKPRHGYEIIKAIEERLAGAYSPSPGVVYPTLTLLEDLGHATVAPGEGGRKLYAITTEGAAFLEASRPALEGAEARIEAARAAYGDGPPPPLLRAVENLKLALRLRVARGGLTEGQIHELAATIDAAATAVERT